MTRIAWLFSLPLVAALLHGSFAADNYPSKAIKLVVPWPPGGASDQRSRQIAEKLAKAFGQPVVVENRPGASGAIGAAAVAKAPADGYTFYYGNLYDLAINPAVNQTLSYDPARDFAPITQAVLSYLVLIARPGLGVRSMKDLVALAKANPGKLTCGSPGNGTAPHFALETLKRTAGVEITHIPFKGSGPLTLDMLGGHVDIAFDVTTIALPHIKAGKLVPVTVSSPKRLAALAEVPTMTEAGFPELEITLWGGFLAPAGTPASVIRRLNTELVKAMNSADLREQWESGGALVVPGTPEEFAAFIQSEQIRWARLIKQTGVKLE
jgi:tripartite-type tricarboxylate transporter receptor subunit TctC